MDNHLRLEDGVIEALDDHQIRVIDFVFDDTTTDGGGQLVCTRRIVNIDEVQNSYSAVSYAWRQSPEDIFINCDGYQRGITKSLFRALQEIWRDDPTASLWADQLSINQDDLNEKMRQVGMMGEIFKSANMVHVWLGDTSPTQSEPLSAISQAFHPVKSENPWQPADQANLECLSIDEQKAVEVAFDHLVKCKYWERAWTFQEWYLASDLLIRCGGDSMPGKVFFSALQGFAKPKFSKTTLKPCKEGQGTQWGSFGWFENMCPFNISFYSGQIMLNLQNGVAPRRDSLWPILRTAWPRQAGDDRDKVYSCLGFWENWHPTILEVDYTITRSEVYTRATRACINHDKSLAIIMQTFQSPSKVEERAKRDPTLPTWVPDLREKCWSNMTRPPIDLFLFTAERMLASSREPANDRSPLLTLPGIAVGRIYGRIEEDNNPIRIQSWPACFRTLFPSSEAMLEDFMNDSILSDHKVDDKTCFTTLQEHDIPENCECTPEPQLIDLSTMGLTIDDHSDGDWVVVVKGSPSLFLLRPMIQVDSKLHSQMLHNPESLRQHRHGHGPFKLIGLIRGNMINYDNPGMDLKEPVNLDLSLDRMGRLRFGIGEKPTVGIQKGQIKRVPLNCSSKTIEQWKNVDVVAGGFSLF